MLQAHGLSKSFGTKVLFEEVSFVISEGRKYGLVGPNGTGKSTLLKILLGTEEPDRGTVTRVNEILGYLPQTLEFAADETVAGFLERALHAASQTGTAEEYESYKVDMAVADVGLEHLDRALAVAHLSGGQKTRLGLARVLIGEPTTLLIDEPTNNLDLESLAWLERFLRRFKGNVLVISHDRVFLDNCVQRIFEIDPTTRRLEEYAGGYSEYVIEKQARYERHLAEYERQERRRQKMEEWIREKQSLLANRADPKAGRRLQAMKTRYEREFERNGIDKPQRFGTVRVSGFGDESYAKKIMFFIEDMSFRGIVRCGKLAITARERIHLRGENGSGKSTFVKLLMGELAPTEGRIDRAPDLKIGYFAQEHEMLDMKRTVIENYMRLTRNGNERACRGILAKYLFSGERVYAGTSELSQGERVKLIIAVLTNTNNQFLILDEPTNHLDIESREVLEGALNEYEGGLIVISHDRWFVEAIGLERVLRIREGAVVQEISPPR